MHSDNQRAIARFALPPLSEIDKQSVLALLGLSEIPFHFVESWNGHWLQAMKTKGSAQWEILPPTLTHEAMTKANDGERLVNLKHHDIVDTLANPQTPTPLWSQILPYPFSLFSYSIMPHGTSSELALKPDTEWLWLEGLLKRLALFELEWSKLELIVITLKRGDQSTTLLLRHQGGRLIQVAADSSLNGLSETFQKGLLSRDQLRNELGTHGAIICWEIPQSESGRVNLSELAFSLEDASKKALIASPISLQLS